MKIVFTTGGTGGALLSGHRHRPSACAPWPMSASFLPPTLYYVSDAPYDQQALFENDLIFLQNPAGKMRRYASVANFTDVFVTFAGAIRAFFTLLSLYPDVVVSKGGYASVPSVLAAHWLHIPIIIHESDAKPGRANLLGAKYARTINIAFESAASYFPKKAQSKVVVSGIPIRAGVMTPDPARRASPRP